MAKQLNVSVAVTADTEQAKAKLKELENNLTRLSGNSANLKIGINANDLQKASAAAAELAVHLKSATNQSTGTLDFTKLNTSIKASGSTLTEYGNQLLKLGPQGQQAFTQLSQAVATSEIPVKRLTGLFGELGTVLKNTIRWQISSSLIHGFMGSISQAFNYAQNLNESLNRIQIVTQASADHMAKFAEQANKAAKQLSTTTTAYTDASLIYYQQGLNDKEVAARTEVTIKMANAAGVSAQKVSDQMTAVWNNFADGSKSLEYYADVMTALGAATASSTDEISQGLEKFASVADTVGLSYENAAAALATITATTRQSADTVGTGLRTLFSRLQSVSLGETLDDGVTLTKYTKALETIGVNALDAGGNLREMDDILEDMGTKWDTLTQAQKVAVAQTVGGVRQYTTLISLMDNFDFYKQNQQVALNSEGTVQKQADTYAKSWEGSQKRVKAATEAIYSDLINDDFFISLNDTLAKALNILDGFIDALGGIRTILPAIAALMTKAFGSSISAGLVKFGTNAKMLFTSPAKMNSDREAFLKGAAQQMAGVYGDENKLSPVQANQLQYARTQLSLQQQYAAASMSMTKQQQDVAKIHLDQYNAGRNAYDMQAMRTRTSARQATDARSSLVSQANLGQAVSMQNLLQRAKNGQFNYANGTAEEQQLWKLMRQNMSKFGITGALGDNGKATSATSMDSDVFLTNLGKGLDELGQKLSNFEKQKDIIANWADTSEQSVENLKKELIEVGNMSEDEANQITDNLTIGSQEDIDELYKNFSENNTKESQQAVTDFAQQWGFTTDQVEQYRTAIIAATGDETKLAAIAKQIEQSEKNATNAVKAKSSAMQIAQKITDIAGGLMAMTSAASAASATVDNLFGIIDKGKISLDGVLGTFSSFASMAAMGVNTFAQLSGVIGPIAAAVVAIGSIVIPAAINVFDQLHESDAEKIERLAEEADKAQTAASNASVAYDTLIENKTRHNQLLEELQRMTAATDEFKNALTEANAIANDIIKTNNLIYGKDYHYDGSTIKFNDGVLEGLESEQLNYKNRQAMVAQISDWQSVYASESANKNKQLNDNASEVSKEIAKNDQLQDFYGALQWYLFNNGNETFANDLNNFMLNELTSEQANAFRLILDPSSATSYQDYIGRIQGLSKDYALQYAEAGQDYYYSTPTIETAVRQAMAAASADTGLDLTQLPQLLNEQLAPNKAITEGLNRQASLIGQSQYSQLLSTLAYTNNTTDRDTVVTDAENLATEFLSRRYNSAEVQDRLNEVLSSEKLTNLDNNKKDWKNDWEKLNELLRDENGELQEQWADYAIDAFINSEDFKNIEGNKEKAQALYDYLAKNLQIDEIEEMLNKTIENFPHASDIIKALTEDVSDQSYNDLAENYKKNITEALDLTEAEDEYVDEQIQQLLDSIQTKGQTTLDKIFGTESENGQTISKQLFENFKDITSKEWAKLDLTSNLIDLFKTKDNNFDTIISQALFGDDPTGASLNKDILNRLSVIDTSSALSALFDLKYLNNTFGDIYSNFYTKALDKFEGETGILSSIFGEEDFQKELKKVQKEFKKTGKISTKNVDDIADSCEDLSEALDLDILSAGAVADAIELYSIGAISSIEDISEELWAALEAANAFEDSLRNAFNYVDNWNPDRSITDLDDFFSKVSKDYFEELKSGTTGSTRLYQEAEALWGKQYSQNLRRFFYDQETGEGTRDNPQARAANYKKTFGEFDTVWEKVQKQGDLLPYWNFLLGSTGNTANNINKLLYGSEKGQTYNTASLGYNVYNKSGFEKGQEYTVSEALGKIGLSQGKNNGDIEFTDMGYTTGEMRDAIKSILGLSDEQADAYLQEISGHSQFMATALQSNDLQAGYDTLIGKYRDKDIHYNEYNGQMYGSDNNGHEYVDYGAMADMQNYALANKDFLDYYSKLGEDLDAKKANGTLTPEEKEQWETWDRNRDAINNLNDSVKRYDESVQKLNDSYDTHIEETDKASEAMEKAWGDLSTDQQERIKASASGAVVGQGEAGTKEEGKDIYDVEGMLEHTKSLLGAKADDMTPEELWEAAAQQAENYGGVLGTKLTNAYGEVKDVTREADESQEDYNKRLQEAKNTLKSSENKQLGKDLFQGIIDAIKELDPATLDEQIKPVVETINELAQAFASLDGSAESIQALTTAFNELAKLPTIFGDGSTVENLQNLVIALDKISGTEFKLDISTSLSPNEISHLAKDFDDMYAKRNIEISIKIIDDASVQQFKGDKQGIKSTLEALNKAAQITLKINGLETLGQQVQAAIDKINATNPTVHVKLDKDQPEGQQGDKGPSEKSNSSRSTTNSDTKGPSAHSGSSKSTVQTEVKSTAKITKVDASDVEPVEIKAEPQFQKNGSRDQSMKVKVLPVVEEEALEEIAKPTDKDVTLNKHSEEIDDYIAEVPSKTVNLLVGTNEPQAAIDALPPSHTLDMKVNVTVGISSAFGSMTLAGGADIIGAMGPSIQAVASGAALSDSRTQAAIEGVRKHYTKGKEGCQYSEGTCRDGGPTGGTATGSTIYHSYVNGSANRYSKPGISLTAEEGPEIVWNKQEGYAYIVGGEGHPEFTVLRPGDRIFNANDTRQILNYNRPKSNHSSEVKDPREMDDALFNSHAPGGSIYGSYGPQSTYRSSRGKTSGGGGDKYERKKFYEPERYHLLTRQIEDLTFWYNELKKARDRAYGTNILKAIDKEIAKVDELKKHNQLLLEEAENYLEKDRALLDELGIKYELDNEGNLANFEELQDQYKKLLELQEDANGEKIADEQLDELQERWNAIEKYEETLDKIRDIKEEISDLSYEMGDLEFEKIELEFNMKLDVTDKQMDLIDYFMSKLSGGAADAAEMLALASQKMDMLKSKAQGAEAVMDKAVSKDKFGNDITIFDPELGQERLLTAKDFLAMTPEQRENLNLPEGAGKILEQASATIQQCLEDLEALKTKGLEAVSAAIDELTSKVEKQIGIFDHYNNMLSTLRDITDLQGIKLTKELRSTLKQLDEGIIQVSKDRITAEKEKYDGLSKMAEDLRKKVQQYTGVDEDLRKGYQEQLDNIEGQMRESMETVLSMYQNALQTAKDMFETTMDEIKEDYNASLSDIYNTTQLMQEAFDRKTAISEQYVDEYESYYKLNKLQRQINKDIDNQMANGNRANKNLKKLLNEIQKLQEDGIQLTAYDLELLEKKYEYEKALADLEDARNAKQTIRLQRDRNGNWGYVYTAADETDLEEYQQAIEDKLYEYTQTATKQAKDLEKELLSIWVETGEKIAQLRMEGAPSSAINDLIDDTQKRADFLTESLKKAGEDINYVLPNWIDLTQNEQFDLSLDDFKETVLSYVTGIEDVEAVSQKMMKAIINIARETKMAVDTYNASIEEINAFVSGGTGDFNASAQTWAAQITKASQENVEKTKEAVDDMVDTFRDVLKEASAFENKFFNEIKPFIQQQEQLLIQLTDAMSQLNGLPSNLQNLQDAAALANGQAKATSYIDENGHTQTQITHLDEGGYTGEWGPEGKLAVLHEKENVFNKKDTINLLKAANILRTLDIQTGNFERGLGEFFNPSVKDNKQTLEQEVYITAEFPNATNHSEIEEAFNNLANRATQYANRKVG